MLDGIQSALQGIRGALERQAESAHHLSRVGISASNGTGRVESVGMLPVTPAEADGEARNDVDLGHEMVEQIVAKHGVEANAASVKAQSEAERRLLDLFA